MKRIALALATALLVAGCSDDTPEGQPSPAPTSSPEYQVDVRPADYRADVTNPWLPLTPGTTLEYVGSDEDGDLRVVVTTTEETELIEGVRCRVVLERLYVDGVLAETTRDYFAQHRNGDVWYFGEDTAELDEDGSMLTTAGTWHAGVAGAEPGIFMPAQPVVGDSHRQEFLPGSAEDFFKVEALDLPVRTPFRAFASAMRTTEWTPLEPGVLGEKFYVRGIGLVREATVRGGSEQLSLARVVRE